MTGTFIFGEALVLGLSSGPACMASCGPVLVPSLLAERADLRLSVRYLSTFLGARFLGYLLFAAAAWELGVLISLPPAPRLMVMGVIHVLLAGVLFWYAYSVGRAHPPAHANPELVTIGAAKKARRVRSGGAGFPDRLKPLPSLCDCRGKGSGVGQCGCGPIILCRLFHRNFRLVCALCGSGLGAAQ